MDVAELGYKVDSRPLRSANAELDRMTGAAGNAEKAIGAMARRVASIVSVGAAFEGVRRTLRAANREFAEFESLNYRVEGVLRATEYMSGVTSQAITDMSHELSRATLAGRQDLVAAGAALTTFAGVNRENFGEIMELAQDLVTVYGGDLRGSIESLGQALEDPITGFQRLRRQGFRLSQQQEDLAASFVRTGDTGRAARVVLDAIGESVGGAGRASGQGLAGRTDSATEAWSRFLEELGKTGPVATTTGRFLQGLEIRLDQLSDRLNLSSSTSALRRWAEGDEDAGRLVGDSSRVWMDAVSRRQQALEQLERYDNAFSRANFGVAIQWWREQLAQAEADMRAAESFGATQAIPLAERARAGQTEAEFDARASAARARLSAAEEALRAFMTPAQQAAEIRTDLAATIAELEGMRPSMRPEDLGLLDQAIAAEQKLAAERISAIKGETEALNLLTIRREADWQLRQEAGLRRAALYEMEQDHALRLAQITGDGATVRFLEREAYLRGEIADLMAAGVHWAQAGMIASQRAHELESARLAERLQAMDREMGVSGPFEAIFEQERQWLEQAWQALDSDVLTREEHARRVVGIEEWAAAQRREIHEETNRMILASAVAGADSLAQIAHGMFGEQSAAYTALFALSKGFAIGEATLAMHQAISKALAMGFPQNIPLMAQAAAQGAAIIGHIQGTNIGGAGGLGGMPGYRLGGWTGNGPEHEVAGLVHGREGVLTAGAMRGIGVGALDYMNRHKALPPERGREAITAIRAARSGAATVVNIDARGATKDAVAEIMTQFRALGAKVNQVAHQVEDNEANRSNRNHQDAVARRERGEYI